MIITTNKKAKFDYFIEDNFEAGIVLSGWEVKSIRNNLASIKESYVTITNGEVFVLGMHISPQVNNSKGFNSLESTKTRKLLLNRKEINKLIGKVKISGYTLVPLDLHLSNNKVKMSLGLCKGKKNYDKKNSIKEREIERLESR